MATLLLVDDDDGVREVLRLYAEHVGLTVIGEAVNGREAVDLAARLEPDVIVLDQEMPVLTGLEALPRLRRRVPGSVIVFYAAAASSEAKEAALDLGAAAYCTKALSPQTLMKTVVEMLEEVRPPVTG